MIRTRQNSIFAVIVNGGEVYMHRIYLVLIESPILHDKSCLLCWRLLLGYSY